MKRENWKKKTLFIPSFTGEIFQKKTKLISTKDIDKGNGVISLSALKKKYYRTRHPIHSYLIYDNLSEVKQNLVLHGGKIVCLNFFQKKTQEFVI